MNKVKAYMLYHAILYKYRHFMLPKSKRHQVMRAVSVRNNETDVTSKEILNISKMSDKEHSQGLTRDEISAGKVPTD